MCKRKVKLYQLAIIITILLFIIFISLPICNKYIFNTNHIKIIAKTSGTWIFSGKEEYYCVKESGKAILIDYFEPQFVISYNISSDSDIDIAKLKIENDTHRENIAKISELIFSETDLKHPFLNKVFIDEDKYFVTVLDSLKNDVGYIDIIYEYSSQKKSLEEVARFRGKTIEHIELYR